MAKLNRLSNLFPVDQLSEQDQLIASAIEPTSTEESLLANIFTPEELSLSPNNFPGTVGQPTSDLGQAVARAKAIKDAKAAALQNEADSRRVLNERVADKELPLPSTMPKINPINVKPLEFSPGSNVMEMPEPELDADVVAAAQKAVQEDTANMNRQPASEEQMAMTQNEEVAGEEQAPSRNNSAILDLLRAGQMIGAGFGGMGTGKVLTPDATALDAIQKNIRNKELDTVAKSESDSKLSLNALTKTEKEAAIQREKELNDPNSQVSKNYRDQVLAMFPQYANSPGVINGSAKQLDETFKFLQLKEQQETRRDNAKLAAETSLYNRDRLDFDKNTARAANLKKDQMLSDKQVETIDKFQQPANEVQAALQLLGKDSAWTGSVDGRIPDMLVGQDQIQFRNVLDRLQDSYRQLITGAGASDKELVKLASRLPSPTDTFKQFQAKAKAVLDTIERSKASKLDSYSRQGKDVSNFIADLSPTNSKETKASFPKQVRKDGKVATVSNEAELKEAASEGWKE